MAEAQENVSTAIFDITHACLQSFDQIVADHINGSLPTQRLFPFDGTATGSSRALTGFDFLGLRNDFLLWIRDAGALSLMCSSLDARLQGQEDIFAMVIELLEMILRNLRRVDRKPGNPSVVPLSLTKLHVPSELWEDVSQAIDYALNSLRLVSVAARSPSFCLSPLEHARSEDFRKVRTTIWYCDIDHDVPQTFDTKLQWTKHIQNLESHPERKLKALPQAQLDILSALKTRVVLRDEFVCPICTHITPDITVPEAPSP